MITLEERSKELEVQDLTALELWEHLPCAGSGVFGLGVMMAAPSRKAVEASSCSSKAST